MTSIWRDLLVFFSGRKSNIPLGMAPSQDASDHQDCYMFSRKSPTKPSFATVTGRGPHPKHTLIFQFPKNKYLKDFGRKGPVYIGLPGSLGNHFFWRELKGARTNIQEMGFVFIKHLRSKSFEFPKLVSCVCLFLGGGFWKNKKGGENVKCEQRSKPLWH